MEVGAEVRVKSDARMGIILMVEDGDILVKFSDDALPRNSTFSASESEDKLEVVFPALQVSATFPGSSEHGANVCQFTAGRCGTVGDARSVVEESCGIPWDCIFLQCASGTALKDDFQVLGEIAQDGAVVLTVARIPESAEFRVLVSKDFGYDKECKTTVGISSSLGDVKRACLYDNGFHTPDSSVSLSCSSSGELLDVNDKIISVLGPPPDFAAPKLHLLRASDTAELTVSRGLGGEELKFFANRSWSVVDIKRHIESVIHVQATAFILLFDERTLSDDEAFLAAVPEQDQVQLQLLQVDAEVFYLGTDDLGEIGCGKFNAKPPGTAADLKVHRRCLIDYFRQEWGPVTEDVLDTCPVEVTGNPESMPDFCKGVVDPPYGGEPISRYQAHLDRIYGGTEAANNQHLTIYSWTEDYENPERNFCPDFFKTGLEWWGVFVHTVGNKETGQVGVFACSISD